MKFHERFDLNVGLEEARRRFLNPVYNVFFLDLLDRLSNERLRMEVESAIATAIGEI